MVFPIDPTTILLILIRFLHFSACLIPWSVFAVVSIVVIPAWNQVEETASSDLMGLHRQLGHLLAICLAVAFLSGLLWLWFAVAGMNGSSLFDSLQPGLFWMVLTETPPGHAWVSRGCIGALLVMTLFLVRKTKRGWRAFLPMRICSLLSVLLAASLALVGHAGAGEGSLQNLELGGDVVHLIAVGMWPLGLVPYALFLRFHLQSPTPTLIAIACIATRRFSSLSLCSVGALTISGVSNSYFLVETAHGLFGTNYGRLLLIKLALFGLAIGLGAQNLLKLKPQLPNNNSVDLNGNPMAALNKIARNILIECCLTALILLIVGLLGLMPPAGHS